MPLHLYLFLLLTSLKFLAFFVLFSFPVLNLTNSVYHTLVFNFSECKKGCYQHNSYSYQAQDLPVSESCERNVCWGKDYSNLLVTH